MDNGKSELPSNEASSSFDDAPGAEPIAVDRPSISRNSIVSARDIERELQRVLTAREDDAQAAANFENALLVNVDFSQQELVQANPKLLRRACFSQATLIGCRFGPEMTSRRDGTPPPAPQLWRDHPSCDLEGADFSGATVFGCNFSGVSLSGASFENAMLLHAWFDMAYDAHLRTWSGVDFANARIENTSFRGARLGAKFRQSQLLYCDFSPARIAQYEVKSLRDPRIEQPITMDFQIPGRAVRALLAEKKEYIDERKDFLSKEETSAWKALITILERSFSEDTVHVPLQKLFRTSLHEADFENALLHECALNAAQIRPRARFERATLNECDFSPADGDAVPVEDAIFNRMRAELDQGQSGVPQSSGRQINGFLHQLASEIADRDEGQTIYLFGAANKTFETLPTALDGASFENAVVSQCRAPYAVATRGNFAGAIIADAAAEESNFEDADFADCVFYKTILDGAAFHHIRCDNTKFDGDIASSNKSQRIEVLSERYADAREKTARLVNRNERRAARLRRKLRLEVAEANDDDGAATDLDAVTMVRETDAPLTHRLRAYPPKDQYTLLEIYLLEQRSAGKTYAALAGYYSSLNAEIEADNIGADRTPNSVEEYTIGCSLRSASFQGAQGVETSFRSCDLEGADFLDADFGCAGGGLGANFDFAFLRSANFEVANLERASFYGATMSGVKGLHSAVNLEGASFLESRGLKGVEFLRADLSGVILPDNLNGFGGILDSIEQLTRQARILFATLMFACAYSILSLAMSDDGDNVGAAVEGDAQVAVEAPAITDPSAAERATLPERTRERRNPDSEATDATVAARSAAGDVTVASSGDFKLPVLGVTVGREIFYIVTPLVVFSFFVMFHLKFSRIWLEAKSLPKRFPDGRMVDRHLFPWIFASLVPIQLGIRDRRGGAERRKRAMLKGGMPSFSIVESVTALLERFLAIVFGWAVAPITLYYFIYEQQRMLNADNAVLIVLGQSIPTTFFLTWTQVVFYMSLALMAFTFFQMLRFLPVANQIGAKIPARVKQKASGNRTLARFLDTARDWAGVTRERIVRWVRNIFAVSATAALVAVGVLAAQGAPGLRLASQWAEATVGAGEPFVALGQRLYPVEVTPPPNAALTLHGAKLEFLQFNAGNARGADFANARLFAPRFNDVDLTDADFSSADLQGADFAGSKLDNASFAGARLQGVDLSNAKGLSARQLADACGDKRTRLPPGLPPLPACK